MSVNDQPPLTTSAVPLSPKSTLTRAIGVAMASSYSDVYSDEYLLFPIGGAGHNATREAQ